MPIQSINPATGELEKSFTPLSEIEVENKIALADKCFRTFRKSTFAERSKVLFQTADILESEKLNFSVLMTKEMGKPFWAASEEVLKCAWVCRFYAENGERFLEDKIIPTTANKSYIKYQPLGIILAIMPWNFPFWQVFRFAAPALMAGNVGILKHASNVPQCALAIEEIFTRAGIQEGAFQTLLIGSDLIPRIIEDPRIKAVTLTGSEPAGSSVASYAGKMIKKSVLELGGSDPFIVMPSADINKAVTEGVKARIINNGQSCIAAKRFIIHEKIFETFLGLFHKAMESLRIDDPMADGVEMGPLATAAILEQLDWQVKESVRKGAKLICGGNRIQRSGYFYSPTILTNIPHDSPAYREELFGPVALLFSARDIDEAIKIANDTPFGLGSSAWTNDEGEKLKFIDEIEAGLVFINGMVVSDPRLPFGGIKHSGYGRELSDIGIKEFTNIKTVSIKG